MIDAKTFGDAAKGIIEMLEDPVMNEEHEELVSITIQKDDQNDGWVAFATVYRPADGKTKSFKYAIYFGDNHWVADGF